MIDLRTERGSETCAGLRFHLASATAAIAMLEPSLGTIETWGRLLADVLLAGGRLLAAGNGGSAAHAQHLTSELVGRYREDRPPFSAIALHAEGSALTAISNDYGADVVFARQVLAHGRAGDVAVFFSTSGQSRNVVRAAEAAVQAGVCSLAVTGAAPNPLAERCDAVIAVDGCGAPAVQEAHQVAVHLLCEAFEAALADIGSEKAAR